MVTRREQQVQRGDRTELIKPHFFAIVDEVDSILIDEARTPLIISGRATDAAELYYQFARIVRGLQHERDYEVDEAKRTVVPTEEGIATGRGGARRREPLRARQPELRAPAPAGAARRRSCSSATSTTSCSDGEVKIVDEFTGRILEGRRWSEGLHQAVEAKEGVKIKEENQTLATVTLQNYFRMYDKLGGMTGTASTEAGEFAHTYDLQVVSIPTNRPMVRDDDADFIYKGEDGKYDAAVEDIAERHENGQPVLVGTISVEKSEKLSRLLEKRGIPHEVLNAKQHEREAEIITQAGQLAAVTVATNMAGRGVDILLGGNPEGLARRECIREGLVVGTDEYLGPLQRAAAPVQGRVQGRGRQGARPRRPVRARHRTARVAAHRQPAARPRRPPGRPRREPLLPLARRRAHAPVRDRPHAAGDGRVVPRRRPARVEDGQRRRSSARSARSRTATSRSARTSSSTTR